MYYINSQTGETQWHAPQVPPPPPQQQQQQQLVPPPPPATGMPQAPAAGWPPAEAAEPRAQGPPPQLLLGDVGGTNLRFALVPLWELRAATLPEPTHRARYRTADFAQLREALARFTAEKPAELGQIVACTLSVCGPVSGGKAKCLAASMGADGWVLEEGALAAALNLQPGGVKLVNDFVAVGLAVAEVDWAAKAEARTTVHAGTPAEGGTVAVLGPGTRLGECFGVRLAGALHILPSEGGESDFVPRTADEWALREHVARSLGVTHVKVEHVVSGAGLKHIYDFLRSAGRKRKADSEGTADAVEEEVRAADDAGAAIAAHGDAAAEGADADCVAAVDMFVEALGAEAVGAALPGLRRRVHRRRRDGEAGAAPRRQREAEGGVPGQGPVGGALLGVPAARRHDGGRRPRDGGRVPVCRQVRPRRALSRRVPVSERGRIINDQRRAVPLGCGLARHAAANASRGRGDAVGARASSCPCGRRSRGREPAAVDAQRAVPAPAAAAAASSLTPPRRSAPSAARRSGSKRPTGGAPPRARSSSVSIHAAASSERARARNIVAVREVRVAAFDRLDRCARGGRRRAPRAPTARRCPGSCRHTRPSSASATAPGTCCEPDAACALNALRHSRP